jgi:hypothetical protein
MKASIQVASKIYGLLLCLFPRGFQNEFKEEMEDVFFANLEDAAKISVILVVRACFFELFDLPVNLVVEHLSSLRKGNLMKNISSEIVRFRVVGMAALGMMAGCVLINWGNRHYSQIINYVGCVLNNAGNCHYSNIINYSNMINYDELQPWVFYLVDAIGSPLPIILCGLMLGIAAGVGRHAFLRVGLWTAAGGILGSLVNIPVKMVASDIWNRTRYLPTREETPIIVLCMLAVACVYGFFYGAGLGFTFRGWKTRLKFAWIGLVANAGGSLTGYFISSVLSSRVPLGNDGPSYIQYSIMGALAGGILGWFFGKERQPEAGPVMGTSNA